MQEPSEERLLASLVKGERALQMYTPTNQRWRPTPAVDAAERRYEAAIEMYQDLLESGGQARLPKVRGAPLAHRRACSYALPRRRRSSRRRLLFLPKW
jgi:hypothetical protein